MANPNMPSYHKSGPPSQALVQKEHSFHLYVHQQFDANQKLIANPGAPHRFGELTVTDWTIRDGPSPGASIVGRVQGLVCGAGVEKNDWFFCDNILFTDNWYNGSSLHFLGKYDEQLGSKGEWAIVGGTGEFPCAQGIASYEVTKRIGMSVIMELNIRVLCPAFPKPSPVNPVDPVDKTELSGGNGGEAFFISDTKLPQRLDSVTIRHGDVIDALAFSYVDQAGKKQTAGQWGGNGGLSNTIVFAPGETVNKVYGKIGKFGEHTVVTSLTIVTNVKPYGPYGKGKGTEDFSIPKENNKDVLGFFARAGLVVDAIGAYVGPSATN